MRICLQVFFPLFAIIVSLIETNNAFAKQGSNEKEPCFATMERDMPIPRVGPQYPEEARNKCLEGIVELEFDIGKDGRPRNLLVVNSEPPRIFDEAAVNNHKRACYRPDDFEDGLPQFSQRLTLTFEVENGCVEKE